MKVTFKLYAALQDYLPVEAKRSNLLELELDEGMTIRQIIHDFSLPQMLCHLVLIDGIHVPPAEREKRSLNDGETLSIWPPVAGG